MRKTTIVIASVGVILLIIAAATAYLLTNRSTTMPARTTTPPEGITTIAESLTAPWSMAFYGDIALVSSRDTGEILEIGETGTTKVVGVIDEVEHRSEGGLLGLAVDEDRLYAYYTTQSDNRISRFTLEGQAGNLSLGVAETVIEGLPRAATHNGGRIAFGPDGYLYATVGDAGVPSAAQDRQRLEGKILRMTAEGDVPNDNPFSGSVVYSYGHRNPQGIAWAEDGTMYASEFGQNTWDELNVIEAGANYGWPEVEGREGRDGFVDPVQQWATSEASPSGIAYAEGRLYIANLRGAVLRVVPTDSINTSREYYRGEYGRIRDVVTAPDGTVWFVTNNTDGRGSPIEGDDRIISVPIDDLM
jgi:glucose/arabinose dehydrogenase